MAKVFVRDLKIETIIGICDWELEVEQPLFFDIEMDADISVAARSDNIADALDYAAVVEFCTQFVKASSCKLLEPLVDGLMHNILQQFLLVDALTVTVRKPQAIATADCAGLTASLCRDQLN